jgi:CRP/FNR family cyclic AMP-dependent transcriptional regulator
LRARLRPRVGPLLVERPEWWRHFIPPSLVYGDAAVTIAADLLIRDSERRCAAVLLRLSGRRFAGPEDTKPVEVSVTQDDLAGAANLSRSSVRSMLGRLAERGLIEQGYRGIAVRAPAALRAFVDEG